MKIFIDTADINEIREANDYGLIDGVTTNPTLISKAQKDGKKLLTLHLKYLNSEWACQP